jgi:hypothetical protein
VLSNDSEAPRHSEWHGQLVNSQTDQTIIKKAKLALSGSFARWPLAQPSADGLNGGFSMLPFH